MKKYLITDPLFYTSTPEYFSENLYLVLKKHSPDFICLRDKQTDNYENLAQEFLHVAKQNLIKKAFLHTDFKLAKKLGFYGVHLPSHRFEDIKEAKELGLQVIASTHTLDEALHCEKLGADFITFSPIFYTPNKGEPKGLEKLKEINDKIEINCFALGGIIDEAQVHSCEKTGVYGFASIRYFL
jgi:thiamine-phosphate pyrophosphorylase